MFKDDGSCGGGTWFNMVKATITQVDKRLSGEKRHLICFMFSADIEMLL